MSDSHNVLWRPSFPQNTSMFDFMISVGKKHNLSFRSYGDLWQWSVSEPAKFWGEVWHYTSIRAHKPFDRVR